MQTTRTDKTGLSKQPLYFILSTILVGVQLLFIPLFEMEYIPKSFSLFTIFKSSLPPTIHKLPPLARLSIQETPIEHKKSIKWISSDFFWRYLIYWIYLIMLFAYTHPFIWHSIPVHIFVVSLFVLIHSDRWSRIKTYRYFIYICLIYTDSYLKVYKIKKTSTNFEKSVQTKFSINNCCLV